MRKRFIVCFTCTHYLDLVLNGLLTRRNFWCIPGMLGNYTIPKWKEFLKSREPILRKSYLSTFIHINKHMDGAWDTFWIKSLNGTFIVLQMKSFGTKKFDFCAWVKKCHFGNFWKLWKIAKMALFYPCLKIRIFLGQMPLFEVVRKCHLGTLLKICLRLCPSAYPSG